jgi:fatty acid desaturase
MTVLMPKPHGAPPLDDHSARPGTYLHAMAGDGGSSYAAFRATLRPHWGRIWAELAATWLLVAVVAASLIVLDDHLGWGWGLLIVPLGAVVFAFAIHHLSCFLHEGAHFNLAPSRTTSDRVANLATGAVVLMDIRSYRVVHLAHHRLLGTARDTERSYFERPGLSFAVKSCVGASVVAVLRNRSDVSNRERERHLIVPLTGALFHVAVVAASALTGHWWLAAAWLLGVFSLYPFLNALRQNLEHRTDDAQPDVDYAKVDQGATTRCFSRTLGAKLIGGVGFSRHLIHHWDPGVSYSNLAAVERFLRTTDAAGIISSRSTSYLRAWRSLRQVR